MTPSLRVMPTVVARPKGSGWILTGPDGRTSRVRSKRDAHALYPDTVIRFEEPPTPRSGGDLTPQPGLWGEAGAGEPDRHPSEAPTVASVRTRPGPRSGGALSPQGTTRDLTPPS